MSTDARFGLRALRSAAAVAALALPLTVCSPLDGVRGRDTALKKALQRVGDGTQARAEVEYGDLAALAKLKVNRDGPKSRWSTLRGFGASALTTYVELLPRTTGIRLDEAEYAVNAGGGLSGGTLIAGGQEADTITDAMQATGWEPREDRLILTDPERQIDDSLSVLGLAAQQVRVNGSDVAAGNKQVNLDEFGDSKGDTLADDDQTNTLAGCLGEVMAARIVRDTGTVESARRNPKLKAPPQPDGVGVGVRTTDDENSTPRSIICTFWPSDKSAAEAAKRLRRAITSGKSATSSTLKYGQIYHNPVTETDGRTVQITAGTPENANAVFLGLQHGDLPGLAPEPKS